MNPRTKRLTYWGAAALTVVALAIPKLTALKGNPAQSSAKGGSRGGGGQSGPVAVDAIVVASSSVDDKLNITGTINPNEQIDVQSEVPGKIVGIYFHEGESVPKGKLLVKINDADLRAQLKRANYQREIAATKEARSRELLTTQSVSKAEYDLAINALNTANADIALIQAQLAKTEIRAPFSGVIGLRNVSNGSYIAPSTRIATLSSINPVKIDFAVPEKYYSTVRTGNQISFSVQGAEGEYTGRVYAVEPKIDQATRTLLVRAVSQNAGGKIFPGSFAEIHLSSTVGSEAWNSRDLKSRPH